MPQGSQGGGNNGDEIVVVWFRIPDLRFSTTLGFRSEAEYLLAKRFLFGRVSGARLPPTDFARAPATEKIDIWIDIEPLNSESANVAFRGIVNSPVYEVELQGFHWDFSKVINTLVMDRAVNANLLPVHGACLQMPFGAALLPGASGAGKSSIALAAMGLGCAVYASELAFVQQGQILCGNMALTIDRAAIELFSLPSLSMGDISDGSRVSYSLPFSGTHPIERVIFPQVHPGEISIRSITSRRARMILFENVVTQLPVTQLLAQETWPIWRPPTREIADRIMQEVALLSNLDPVIVSGHPRRIASEITAGRI